jgi:hypothetical protein
MRVGEATATAATEILEAASETARATSTAAMDILSSATRAARATATAAADILDAVTKTTSAASAAATDVLQAEVQRRIEGLPLQTTSIPSPPVSTSQPFSISPPRSSSYFNADGSTRLNRTSASAPVGRYLNNMIYDRYFHHRIDNLYIVILITLCLLILLSWHFLDIMIPYQVHW